MVRFLMLLVGVGLLGGCGDRQTPQKETRQADAGLPTGTWFLYAGSSTGDRMDRIDQEMTILILEDSTYALTFVQPQIQINFSETGAVEYHARTRQMTFTVHSAMGVDFSGDEPRRLIDVTGVVPWERTPGTVYAMSWEISRQFDEQRKKDREVLSLSAEGFETSFFVRVQDPGSGEPILDVGAGMPIE